MAEAADSPPDRPPSAAAPVATAGDGADGRPVAPLRGTIPAWAAVFWGFTCIAAVVAVWFVATAGPAGEPERRFVSPTTLPSVQETVESFPVVFGERKLVANTLVTLKRVCLGFGLAVLVGVPAGILAACFPACGPSSPRWPSSAATSPWRRSSRSPSPSSASATSRR